MCPWATLLPSTGTRGGPRHAGHVLLPPDHGDGRPLLHNGCQPLLHTSPSHTGQCSLVHHRQALMWHHAAQVHDFVGMKWEPAMELQHSVTSQFMFVEEVLESVYGSPPMYTHRPPPAGPSYRRSLPLSPVFMGRFDNKHHKSPAITPR